MIHPVDSMCNYSRTPTTKKRASSPTKHSKKSESTLLPPEDEEQDTPHTKHESQVNTFKASMRSGFGGEGLDAGPSDANGEVAELNPLMLCVENTTAHLTQLKDVFADKPAMNPEMAKEMAVRGWFRHLECVAITSRVVHLRGVERREGIHKVHFSSILPTSHTTY